MVGVRAAHTGKTKTQVLNDIIKEAFDLSKIPVGESPPSPKRKKRK
jgi:hypothetical protein